jgi:tetratricopeptide (TPR) repeat protein
MYHAEKNKVNDALKYIQYLKKSLSLYPPMKKGIQILLDEFNHNKQGYNSEFNQYKDQMKKTLETFIHKGRIEEAKAVITQYEEIMPGDIDLYAMKAVIALVENQLDIAEKILGEGLIISPLYFDLLYNLAYLYSVKGEKEKAISLYNKIGEHVEDVQMQEQIQIAIEEAVSSVYVEEIACENEEGNKVLDMKNELEIYKKDIKDQVHRLIQEEKIVESKSLIREYEKIVPNDLEILVMKSQIAAIEK